MTHVGDCPQGWYRARPTIKTTQKGKTTVVPSTERKELCGQDGVSAKVTQFWNHPEDDAGGLGQGPMLRAYIGVREQRDIPAAWGKGRGGGRWPGPPSFTLAPTVRRELDSSLPAANQRGLLGPMKGAVTSAQAGAALCQVLGQVQAGWHPQTAGPDGPGPHLCLGSACFASHGLIPGALNPLLAAFLGSLGKASIYHIQGCLEMRVLSCESNSDPFHRGEAGQ